MFFHLGLDHTLLQILSKFGFLRLDFYKIYLQLLNQYKLLNTNCVEVGAGVYPRIGELAAPIINKNGKELTLYDPRLSFDLDNVKIVRDVFTKDTDISKVDTLYGLFPCDGTIPIVEKALEEDKNLLVAFCGCDHSTEKYPKWITDVWADDFCMNIKEEYGDEVDIIKWPSKCDFCAPIMVRTTAKQKNLILQSK